MLEKVLRGGVEILRIAQEDDRQLLSLFISLQVSLSSKHGRSSVLSAARTPLILAPLTIEQIKNVLSRPLFSCSVDGETWSSPKSPLGSKTNCCNIQDLFTFPKLGNLIFKSRKSLG